MTRLFVCCTYFFFFFQAEDGIRDLTVTGVQTCALPISALRRPAEREAERRLDLVEDQHRSGARRDRKSTRLNSSHSQISYAVFCLKKKKTTNARPRSTSSPPGEDRTDVQCSAMPAAHCS